MRLLRQKPHLILSDVDTQSQITALFEQTRVLVEVVCPGAASDFYLFDEKTDFDRLVEGLPRETEIFLTSVIDLRNRQRALRIAT